VEHCPGNNWLGIPYRREFQAFLSWFSRNRLLRQPMQAGRTETDFVGNGVIARVRTELINGDIDCSAAPIRPLRVPRFSRARG
jgi:hypothetical protein